MTLRDEALNLIATLPEKYLRSIITLMKNFNELEGFDRYKNHGRKLFKDKSELDAYISELRSDRF